MAEGLNFSMYPEFNCSAAIRTPMNGYAVLQLAGAALLRKD